MGELHENRPIRVPLGTSSILGFLSWALLATAFVSPNVAVAQTMDEVAKLVASDGGSNSFMGGAVALSGTTAVVGGGTSGTANSAYVFIKDANGDWVEQQKLTPSDGVTGDRFGVSVAVFGDTAVIGAERADGCSGSCADAGAAYVFVRDGAGVWSQQKKLTAGDAGAGDWFGGSVAVSGNTALIGARGDDDIDPNSGAAYVFERTGTLWLEQQKLGASDGAWDDVFGSSVALEGTTALIGAQGDDDNGSSAGAAYAFVQTGGLWLEQQKLKANSGDHANLFGYSVSLSGSTALIGAPNYDAVDGVGKRGAAFVFTRSGSVWSEQQTLSASDAAANDQLGRSVSVSGGVALVGAPFNSDNGYASGSAYVYVLNGSFWSEFDKFTASDAMASDFFGEAVSVSGSIGIVGARSDDNVYFGSNVGSVYVFETDTDGDGIPDSADNCPAIPNPTQSDGDVDGFGDACDVCPADELNDVDIDGYCGNDDNCPNESNADQTNSDGDMLGDACDPCPHRSPQRFGRRRCLRRRRHLSR